MENATPIPPDAGPLEAESHRRGHEVRDASVRACVIFLVVMFGTIALIQWGLTGLLGHDKRSNERHDESPNLWTGEHPMPPGARLQPSMAHPENPSVDMEKLTKKWDQELNEAGPSAAGEPYVRVPIKEAIDRAVREGLPKPATTRAAGGER